QLRYRLCRAREREHVEELQLVVQVVLEPQHDRQAVAQRIDQPPVPPLERRENRGAAPPPALREERGTDLQQPLPRYRGNRPFVENVLPREDRAAERRLPQRVAGALAVGDVQKRRARQRLATAPRQVRGAAGA